MSPAVPLALVIVQVLFASLAIAGRYVLPEFPAGLLVSVRVLGAAAVLLVVNTLRGGPFSDGTFCTWTKPRCSILISKA